jgi:TolB-like protein/DNA-binding winged helix-turn-helix (wHTH) protein/tetratricopeptide (TPR) repeat protein
MPAKRRYSFGEYTLDLDRGALLKAGADVKLRPKSYEVLRLLVQRHGKLVTKEELMGAVWGRAIVTDGSLGQCLIDVRRAIGDDSQQLIRTLSRRGYIFDVPVTESDAPDRPGGAEAMGSEAARDGSALRGDEAMPRDEAMRSRVAKREHANPSASRTGGMRRGAVWLAGATAVAVIVATATWWTMGRRALPVAAQVAPAATPAPAKSIAVLPFVNMSAEPEQEYFTDGVSEEILNLLAQTPGLLVIARTSSFSFKGRNADVAQIAGRLNVAYVLEGSVRKTGERVRITAQLIDARNSTHLWSSTYDRTLDDIFKVQSDIAGAVTRALRVEMLGSGAPDSGTTSPAAFERYLQGRFFFGRRSRGDMERAKAYFEEALAIDPQYARAWVGLAAVAVVQIYSREISTETGLPQLRSAAEKALVIDPGLGEAYLRLSAYHWIAGDRATARLHYRRAKELSPNSPLIWAMIADEAAQEGNLDEAIERWQHVVALDPLTAANRHNLGVVLFNAGRFAEARAERVKVLEINPDAEVDLIAYTYLLERNFDAAAQWLQRLAPGVDRDVGMAMLHYALGRTADADAVFARLIEAVGAHDPFRLGEVQAYRLETDDAFRWLQAAVDTPEGFDPLSTTHHGWEMVHSPFLQSLHTDVRWPAWVEQARKIP